MGFQGSSADTPSEPFFNRILWNVWEPRPVFSEALSSSKCPLNVLNLNGVVCSNTLFSNTSALTSSLLFWGEILHARFSNTSFARTLPGSNFGGLLLEQTFCRHRAAFQLKGLNAILSLLQPLDRYRTPSAIGSAIGRPYLALSRFHAQVGALNRLVLNRLGGSTAR